MGVGGSGQPPTPMVLVAAGKLIWYIEDMGKTLAEKILSSKSGTEVKAGGLAVVQVDLAFVQDSTGPLTLRQFAELGITVPRHPERTILFIDHSAPSPAKELSNDHLFLRRFAKEKGVVLSDIGEGVCHQRVAEAYASPGEVVVGADSHTVTAGALGAFGTGMGSTDIAVAMALGKTWFRVPETIRVHVYGRFPAGVYGKDLILHLIGLIGADGATYKALEFGGDAVADMAMNDRLTIANMAVEAGAKVGLFPSDKVTQAYLEHQGRGHLYTPLQPDPDAAYERTIDIDVAKLEPTISQPHTVDNTALARALKDVHVDQVFLGTCTNGRLEDFKIAAGILQGRKRHPGTRLVVAPASPQIYLDTMAAGYLAALVQAGATVVPPGCAACLGVHQGVLGDGEVCLSTANRNFKGRMGNPNAFVYLGSPAAAAVTAVTGHITDPREFLRS